METAGRAWVVGAAVRDVVVEAAVREVVVVSASKCMEPDMRDGTLRWGESLESAVSKCMEPDRLGGTLHWGSVLLDGLRSTG